MPRKSPYEIVLSPDEARELSRRTTKYTLPYFKVIRAKMILLAAEGLSNDEIADRLDTRREIVSMWRKRFFEARLQGLEERPRPGLPPDFSPQIWWFTLRPWLVNCQPLIRCRFLDGALPMWPGTLVKAASWPPSVTVPYGAGSMRTPFDPGTIDRGSSLVIPNSPQKQGKSWTSMKEYGTGTPLKTTSSFCLPMRRQVFRLVVVAMSLTPASQDHP